MKKLLIITIILIPSLIYFFIFLKQTKAQVCTPLTGIAWSGPWQQGIIPMASSTQFILTGSPIYVSGGNVGIDIGNTTPAYKLQVNGDISGTRLCIGSDCRSVWPGGGIAGTGSAGQVTFWTGTINVSGDNNLFWDNTNKRLGIGTTTPQTSLHVAGNITANTFLGIINAGNVSSGQFGANTGGGNYYFMGSVGIGTTTPTYRLDVVGGNQSTLARFGTSSAATVDIGNGSGKLNVGTIDPIYTIGGRQYATYLPGMTGQKEETAGVVYTECKVEHGICLAVLDFANAPEGSDLWLFAKVTNLKANFDKLVALLTPSFNGRVWYEKDFKNFRLIIYAFPSADSSCSKFHDLCEISYRLTAPRFDAASWPNAVDSQSSGFIINE